MLRFHHFKPSLNGFLYICKGFFMGFPLRKTARKRGNLGYKVPGLILFNNGMQFHGYLFFNKGIIKKFLLAIQKRKRCWLAYFPNLSAIHYSNIPKKEVSFIHPTPAALRLTFELFARCLALCSKRFLLAGNRSQTRLRAETLPARSVRAKESTPACRHVF